MDSICFVWNYNFLFNEYKNHNYLHVISFFNIMMTLWIKLFPLSSISDWRSADGPLKSFLFSAALVAILFIGAKGFWLF